MYKNIQQYLGRTPYT